MKALQKHVGKRIRQIREQKGISQEALADRCALHRTYIGLIERGQRNLTVSAIEVIARELQVAPAEFFAEAEVATAPIPPLRSRQKSPTLEELAAHVAVMRNILINNKLIDRADYDAEYERVLHPPTA